MNNPPTALVGFGETCGGPVFVGRICPNLAVGVSQFLKLGLNEKISQDDD